MPGPLARLSLLPYAQSYNGSHLTVRLLLIPGGSPQDPLSAPGSPSFATAHLTLSVVLTDGLTDMPPGGTQTITAAASPAPARAAALFGELAAMFNIDPAPPPATPRRAMTVLKHLPPSYREATGLTQPASPYARTDDSYACAHRRAGTLKPAPNPAAPVPWGRVIAIAMRQPLLAEALGLVRPLTIAVPAGVLAHGGWLHVTLDPAGDAGLLASPGALAIFATRLGPLTVPAPLFSSVLFPVPPNAAATYDAPFAEAIDYADGFAKVVHAAQQRTADPYADAEDGTRPLRETGIRLAWDDEQLVTWLNRQAQVLGPADPDTTMGVAGYHIDARKAGDTHWHSLCAAAGPVTVGTVGLGTFTGELPVETPPVQLDAEAAGEYWLGAYLTRWLGGPVIGGDPIGLQLSGGPAPQTGRVTPTDPGVALRYGTTYQLRVRLADHTCGGPVSTDQPTVPGIAPVVTLAFRRWIPPGRPDVDQPVTPDTAQVTVRRPRLGYPAYPCTGAANAVADLLNDLPAAKAAGREPSLPDPDVAAIQVDILVRALGFDPLAQDGYVRLYTATRQFPPAPADPLVLALDWRDTRDATTLADPGHGALPVPTSRDVRIELRALGRTDPDHHYFGADDVRLGPAAGVHLRRAATDERSLLVTGPPSELLRAIYLQPDPADDPTLAAATQAAGQAGQPGDSVARLAAALDLDYSGLTLRSRPGHRLVIGAAAGLRHALGPDHGSLTVASRSELTRQWLVALSGRLDRDWTWDGLVAEGITVSRDGNEVGRIQPAPALAAEGEVNGADRTGTDLLFLDVVDTRPPVGTFPRPTSVTYTLHADYVAPPAHSDNPLLTQTVTLPVTNPPVQVPTLTSAGVALSPYQHSDDYSSTQARRRMLWLQFDSGPNDPDDAFFARVLRSAPDPLIAGVLDARVPDQPVEPPLPVDPEFTRVVVPGQSDDRAGLGAMQRLIPGDLPGYYLLPLPPGIHDDDPALLGFWTYELRAGHAAQWSTAQGRFGNPLRVAGLQHPPPPVSCNVARYPAGVVTSAAYANPVYEGVSLRPFPPVTQIWMLLYTQVTRADRAGQQNVLLGRRLAAPDRSQVLPQTGYGAAELSGNAAWQQFEIAMLLQAVGLGADSPLSVLAVEVLPNEVPAADPMGADLGTERILRTSPLVQVPTVCV
jgi:hypothetical protein